jgi:hypothetical protein
LSYIILPDSIESIGDDYFSGCASLISISLPLNLKFFISSCFLNSLSLSPIFLPDSLQITEQHCFRGCISLWKINYPLFIKTVGYEVFSGCDKLPKSIINQFHDFF